MNLAPLVLTWAVCAATALPSRAADAGRPNIVLMVADDLGYNDLGCYGAERIKTPQIDRLASQGARFTDAHSVCAICIPSRYSILSGTYFFNAKFQGTYQLHFHAGQVTLPSLLKSAGYATAAFGKWHNGFGRGAEPDYNQELKPGPLEIGFDSFFGTPRTHSEPPLVFVRDHRVVGLDPQDPLSVDHAPEHGAHGKQIGGAAAMAARPADQVDMLVTDEAVRHLERQPADRPFFLYLAFNAVHNPLKPAPGFIGTSKAGRYGDFAHQLDHCVGRVLDALEKSGLAENTLVILTSDNGGRYEAKALRAGHRTTGTLLGQKTDAWEGGHRVAFLARWPGRIPAGSLRKELFLQVDLMATLAAAARIPLPAGASPDGSSELAAFLDPAGAPAKRREAVLQGTTGLALRQGDWVFLPKQGSGGKTAPEPAKPWSLPYAKMGFENSDIDARGQPKPDAAAEQLYHLADDPSQHTNVAKQHPERVAAMRARLTELTRNATKRTFGFQSK
jgi:arylsulfatase A-like enzyme